MIQWIHIWRLELKSGVFAEEVEFFDLDFEVLHSSDCDAYVIGVAMVVVGDDCRSGFVGLVCGFISSAADS